MINKIIELINENSYTAKTVILGLDGPGGAGKSTLAQSLSDSLSAEGRNTVVFHIDDFIHPRAVRYNDAYPQWEQYYYLQWRYDYFMREVIGKIKAGKPLSPIELYDKENDTYKLTAFDVPEGSVVIAEGVFLMREELAGAFDSVVYMDVPKETRLQRVLERDGYIGSRDEIQKKYDERYFPAEDYYISTCKPTERADLVI